MPPENDRTSLPESEKGRLGDTASAVTPEAARDALAGRPIRSSARTADFLRYVVTEVLEGRGDRLRERAIANAALGRGPDFDPRIDPAVRVQAARVRRALDRYYSTEGRDDPVRIVIPRGRYAPQFVANPQRRTAARSAAAGPSVVVVSLADLTPGGDLHYIAPGISEVLVARLSRFPGCRVIGPVSRAGAPPDPRVLGTEHDAQFVLLGSTRTRDGALRVSVRLVDAATGETVWSRVYDRRIDDADAFGVEDSIVTEVAAAIGDYRGAMHLHTPSGAGAAGDRTVHDAMLRYYGWLGDTAPAGFLTTLRALEEAARRDPDNSLILSMLAGMNLVDAIDRVAGLDRPVERAEELANRAIAIDPANPHAVAALAWLALVQHRVDVCHERMEQLLRLCPDHPTFLYRAGFVFAVTGQWERGVGLVEASLRLNPNGPGYLNFFPAMDLCLRGEYAAALQRAYLVDTPGGHLGPLSRAVSLARLGRLDEARAELDVLRSAVPAFDEDREAALRTMLMPPPVLAMSLDALDAIEPVAG